MARIEELHHVDMGVGPSIVLIHGLASNLRLWDGVAWNLRESGHRVVACDLRGHGRSPKPDSPSPGPLHGPAIVDEGSSGVYDVATVAGDVIDLIERLELGACLLVGQSYGGTVALQIAADRPDLTASVVGIDGGFIDLRRRYPQWDRCRRDLAPPSLVGRPLGAIRGRMRSERADWPPEALEAQVACFEVRADGTIAPWLTFEHHMEVLHGLWEVDTSILWSTVKAPVLLVAAERPGSPAKTLWHEDLVRCRNALALQARAEIVWMQGDHDLHAQQPGPVARLIENWGRGKL